MESKLKAIRRGNRAAVTKFVAKFEELKNPERGQADIRQFQHVKSALVQKRDNLIELQKKLIEVLSEEDIAEEIEDAEEYIFNLDEIIGELETHINTHINTNPSNPDNDRSAHPTLNPNAQSYTPSSETININTSARDSHTTHVPHAPHVSHENQFSTYNDALTSTHGDIPSTSNIPNAYPRQQYNSNNIRLPKLELPNFDGDVLQWSSFWDAYESTIHYNNSLTHIQKFSYLKAQLSGTAAQTIAGLALSNRNYDIAVNLLQERFGSPQKIINAYMKALNELPAPTNELHSLRNYGDSLETYIRSLESLGQTQEMYGALLVPIIISKLPLEIRKNIAREYDSDNIELKILRKAITKEVRILETGENDAYDKFHATATFLTGARKPQQKYNKSTRREKPKVRPCIYCSGDHYPTECKKVTNTEERMSILKRKKSCFNCLGDHRVADCKSQKRCKICNRKHHTSVCGDKPKTEKRNENIKTEPNINVVKTDDNASVLYSTIQHTSVLLKTAIAPVGFGKHSTHANILFDEGAQRSFISKKLAEKLEIRPQGRDTIELSAFGDKEKNIRHLDSATIYLQTDDGGKLQIHVLIVPDIAVPLRNHVKYVSRNLPYLRNLKLAHPMNNEDNFEISLLIGADHYWEVVQDTVIRGNGPTAVASKIGYLLSGPVTKTGQKSTTSVLLNVVSAHDEEESAIEKFWNLESLGIQPPELDKEESFLKTYQQKSIGFEKGRYTMELPWKLDHKELPTNKEIVKTRTESTIRRLSREPHLLTKYHEIINDQEKRNFIEKVDEDCDTGKPVHYIPHHSVKKDSTTTPIRIVFDCSCKQSPDHPSLNECLMPIPPDINDLTKILMRFRMKKYGISTDIEKAFLNIALAEKDRDFTRFFWMKDPNDPDKGLTTYRFKSILFGATCSPFILNATLLKHLDSVNTELTTKMKQDLYVDNILSSVDSESEAVEYFQQTRPLMLDAGFNLRSWSSNSSKLNEQAINQNVNEKDTTVKILGLKWNTDKDDISFQNIQLLDTQTAVTKREILSMSSRIYDPLGLLSPVSVRAKVLMQELWKRKFTWDEPLPSEIQTTWNELATDLEQATHTKLNRQYITMSKETKQQLHVFVDASLSAYGATVYMCNENESSIVIAKNKVAPLKDLTLPQLELMAALIGARLANHVKTTLKIENVSFWSDSQIVLHWLSTTKQLKKFIKNRVQEIRSLTNEHTWRYCPTKDNPADLLTRGIRMSQFENNSLWFNGPKWLTDKSKWPTWKSTDAIIMLTNTETEESDNHKNTQKTDQAGIHCIVQLEKYSTLTKLLRVTAYVIRFVTNTRTRKTERKTKHLTTEELQNATEIWINNSQQTTYSHEFGILKSKIEAKNTSLIRQLRLFLDNNDAIRCGGRINNAPVSETTKYPYLLPRNHPFTKLIVLNTHRILNHAGGLSTCTQTRQTYWIPQIRQYVRTILRNCVPCRKLSSKPYNQPDPPPLPKMRLMEAPPFTVTGVDYTGAFFTKDKHGIINKVFLCLFTCASTRAVHLEIAPDLTEESFLLAFRRFCSRKSRPSTIISDNATTFLAASETLKKLTESTTINDALATYGTKWTFIPKGAPWYGGFWERLIGLTKSCLKKSLGRSFVSIDMLQTIVTEIEATINDRPLTYISPDIQDQEPLTPSMLLYGRRINTAPYPRSDFNETAVSGKHELKSRFNTQTTIIEHFWSRWRREYLTSLREFHGHTGINRNNIRIGDVVQVQDDKLPRNRWNIAIVDELITGNDGFTRAVIIRNSKGRTSRPVVKLYPLEIPTNTYDFSDGCDDASTSTDTKKDVPTRREAAIRAREQIKRWTKC